MPIFISPVPGGGQEDPAAAGFRVLDRPERLGGGTWRITWSSVAGRRYRLQSNAEPGAEGWVDVVTVTADGPVTSAEDPTAGNASRRFWRAVLEMDDPGMDTVPPAVSAIAASFVVSGGNDAVRLVVTASDDVGVDGVVFLENGEVVGAAAGGENGSWSLIVPGGEADLAGRTFLARATDAAGNAAFSPGFTFPPVPPQGGGGSSPGLFVPLDPTGRPVDGGALGGSPDGTLPPFQYKPAAGGGGTAKEQVAVTFPAGARLVMDDPEGEAFIEFDQAEASFGSGSALQFAVPLTFTRAAALPGIGGVAEDGAGTGRLPVGDVDYADLAAAFGFDPAAGYPVDLFGRFPLTWLGGTLTDTGMRAPRFRFDGGFPLPEVSGDFPDLVADLFNRRELSLPFYGEFPLPGGEGAPARLRVPADNPIWLTLCADGSVRLRGRVEVELGNGASFQADVVLDDPHYRLQIAASGVEVPLIGNLAELLPDDAAACLPAGADPAALDDATRCLRAFAAAYRNFNASVAGAGALGAEVDAPTSPAPAPPGALTTAGSVLAAWGHSALADAGEVLPLDGLEELLRSSGRSAAGALDLETVLRHHQALMRARLAVEAGALAGGAGAEAELAAALAEAAAAAVSRARDPGATLNLDNLREVIRLLLETEALRQAAGVEGGDDVLAEVAGLVGRFALSQAAALGVEAGSFSPEANEVISAMDRVAAVDTLARLVSFAADAALLGADEALSGAPFDETLAQLALHLFGLADEALEATETAGDAAGFAVALESLVGLAGHVELGVFPDVAELAGLPGAADLAGYGARLDALLVAALERPRGRGSVAAQSAEAERLLELLGAAGGGGGGVFSASPFARVFDGLETEVAEALDVLFENESLLGLSGILEAGLLQARLGAEFGLEAGEDWYARRLPLVVARLGELAEQLGAWGQLDLSAGLLLDEADRLAGEDEVARRAVLAAAAELLASARRAAVVAWERERDRREELPLLLGADLFLPGELTVDRVAGSAAYHRTDATFAGSFSGELHLPRFDAALTVLNASFDGAGNFDLSAYGTASFPPGEAAVTVEVPARRPVHVSFRPGVGIELAGAAGFRLPNGMFFEGELGFRDPVYTVRMSAGGLELDLLEVVTLNIPTFPGAAGLDEAAASLWNRYYKELAESFSALGLGRGSAAPAAGERPEFERPAGAGPFEGLDALELQVELDVMRGADFPDYGPVLDLVDEVLENLFAALEEDNAVFAQSVEPEVAASPDPPWVFQVDLGLGGIFGGDGPAHEFGFAPSADRTWNGLGADATQNLVLGNGAAAEGFFVDLGVITAGEEAVDWTLQPTRFNNGATGLGGLIDTDLLRDGLISADENFGRVDSRLAVRVGGLGPGYFAVYALVANPPNDANDHLVQIGKLSGNKITTRDSTVSVEPGVVETAWIGSAIWAGRFLSLGADDDLVIITAPGNPRKDKDAAGNVIDVPTSSARWGQLQGFQVVKLRPEISRFTVAPTEINLGEVAELSWATSGSTHVSITGLGRVRGRGEQKVAPQHTTTYTLRAANAGGFVTRKVTLRVRTPEQDYAQLMGGIAGLSGVMGNLAETLSEIQSEADAQDPEKFAEVQRRVREQIEQGVAFYNQVLDVDNQTALQDIETIKNATTAALNFAAAGAAVGLEDIDLGRATQFVDQGRVELERKFGYNPDTGQVDTGFVNSVSAEESVAIIEQLLEVTSGAQSVGADATQNQELLESYVANAAEKLLESLAFDPATGEVDVAARDEEELREVAEGLLKVVDGAVGLGQEVAVPNGVFVQVGDALQEEALATLGRTDRSDWRARLVSVGSLDLGNAMRARGGQAPRLLDELRTAVTGALVEMARRAAGRGRLDEDEAELMRVAAAATGVLDAATARDAFRNRIGVALRATAAAVDETWTADRLDEGVPLVEELAALQGFIKALEGAGGSVGVGASLLPDAQLPRLRDAYAALCKDEDDPAPEELAAFTGALLEAAATARLEGLGQQPRPLPGGAGGEPEGVGDDTFAELLADLARETLADSAELAAGYAGLLANLTPEFLPVDLTLPGDLRVERVFGSLFYNRDTGFLRGGFGGRLVFPDTGATLEVTEATLASDGSFTFAAETAGPLPFGGVTVEAQVDAAGDTAGSLDLSGAGMLTVPGVGGAADQTFAVAVSYDSAERRLGFQAEGRDLDLRLSDDFVLFDAGFGLEVSTGSPEGEFNAQGSAGMFALGELPAGPSGADFHLVAEGVTVRFNYRQDGVDLALADGQLRLPEFFQEAGNAARTPRVALTPARPVEVGYDAAAGSVSFSGGVLFADIFFEVPGIEGFTVDVANAELLFTDSELPSLRDLDATLVLPLPNRDVEVAVEDVDWALDGFPTGTVRLRDNLALFAQDGFEFALLGEGSEGCPESFLEIVDLDGAPAFELAGGLGLTVPADLVTFLEGDALTVRTCGRLAFGSGVAPFVDIERVEVTGDYQIVPAEGVTLNGATIVAENIGDLFDPGGGGEPFRLSVTGGGIELPNGAFFALNEGSFSLDGTFVIDAEAGAGNALSYAGVEVVAAVRAELDAAGVFSIAGDGTLTLLDSGGTFEVAIAYDTAGQELRFESAGADLDLRFSDQFVLFEAGFGFTVRTDAPGGSMTVSGTAGMVALEALGESVSREDFQLVVDGAQVAIAFDDAGFSLALEEGTLCLPDLFSAAICPGEPEGGGPQVALDPAAPIFVTYDLATGEVAFGGEISFRNLGFEVPGIEGLAVEVCRATLRFSDGAFPALEDIQAALSIPLPQDVAVVAVSDAMFSLDGFPVGTIALVQDLLLFESGGFTLSLLGTRPELCPAGTALTIESNNGQPFFRLDGGVRFAVPADLLQDDAGGELFAQVCAGVEFGFGQPPLFDLEALAIGGAGFDFRIGGADGLVIKDGFLEATGISNLFDPTPENPFVLRLTGGFEIVDGPGFALDDAKFTFAGDPLPVFSIRGASVSAGSNFEVVEGLPLSVSEAGFTFVDPGLPLPDLLHPENLIISLSAELGLPPEDPLVSGQVQDLTVRLEDGLPVVQVGGIGLGIEDFEIAPLSLTGQVFIGNLDDPENLYFAGNVGGKLNGAGVVALLAFNLRGPLGVCFDVSTGPGGIVLGQTGIMITGVAGGVSFLNTNGDPCDFSTFVNLGEDGKPAALPAALPGPDGELTPVVFPQEMMTWEELRAHRDRYAVYEAYARQKAAQATAALAAVRPVSAPPHALGGEPEGGGEEPPQIPCPTGDCPPATVNILCQPHPDDLLYPDRVILKFSSLDESTLNEFGLTRDLIESGGFTTAPEIGETAAAFVRTALEDLTPRPDPGLVGPGGEPLGEELNALIDDAFDRAETAFAGAVATGVQGVLGDAESVYDAIVGAAYAGVSCPDATVKLTGTFSHLAVSSFLSGTGGVVLSTTGSAGLVGSVNLFGIPVGNLRGFVNATDADGLPNPSLCGQVRLALGPLELGAMDALYECPGCVTGVLGSFVDLGVCLGDDIITSVMEKVAPEKAHLTGPEALGALDDAERSAFLAELFTRPASPGLQQCFLNFVINSLGSIEPYLGVCGEVAPKIFGIGLGESLVEVNAAADKTSMAGSFSFATTSLIPYVQYLPPQDKASLGFGVAWPNPDDLIIGALTGRYNSPQAVAAYVEESFAYMLENATFTIGYELSPMGLKGFQSGARVVMPNLTAHPELTGWAKPEDRGVADLPTRLEVMIAAVEKGFLDNPLWKGTEEDLFHVFEEGDPRRAAAEGLSFSGDYFPHGGVVGAARLALPRAIVDAPPESLSTVVDPAADVFARLGAGFDYVSNYVLMTSEVGTLGFYLPAPNPPFPRDASGNALPIVDAAGNPLGPQELLAQIQSFDPLASAEELYPIELAFVRGYLDGRLLGIPIVRAEVSAEDGLMRVATTVPEGSWMEDFVDRASMEFEIRQVPPKPIEERFTELAAEMQVLIDTDAGAAEVGAFVEDFAVCLIEEFPKVSLEMAVDNFRVPDPLANVIGLDGSTSALFVAYSPRFEPDFAGEGPVALARQNGGVGLRARLRFLDLVTIDNAELAVFVSEISPLTGLPQMAGQFDVPLLTLGPGVALHDTVLEFNSEPDIGSPYVAAAGEIDTFTVGPFLEVRSLTGAARLSGELRALRTAGTVPAVALSLDPAALTMPIFGDGFEARMHGATADDPFTFSTDGPWAATVSISGGLVLTDPLTGTELLQVGADDEQFLAAVSGDGLTSGMLELDIPLGIDVIAFPGQAHEQSFVVGVNGDASLLVSSDGTFRLEMMVDDPLTLTGLPASVVDSGASLLVTESFLRVSGNIGGGSLALVSPFEATGTLSITRTGVVAFAGDATVPPLQLGRFRVSGLGGGNLELVVDTAGLRVPSGAKLALQGLSGDLFTLEEFTIESDGDFEVAGSGQLGLEGYFCFSGGDARLVRADGVTRFELVGPTATVLEGTDYQTVLPVPLETVVVESTGRFYYDSGAHEGIGLPGAITAGGRLEFGYEPDANAPALQKNRTSAAFGQLEIGESATQTVRVTNTGGSQLFLFAGVSGDARSFSVTPNSAALAPAESADFTVRFRALDAGNFSAALNFLHNGPTTPEIVSLSGSGRAVPLYYASQEAHDFGQHPVGGGDNHLLFVANPGRAPLEISSITTAAPFTVSPASATVPPGESVRLFTTFVAGAVTDYEEVITLVTNAAGSPHTIELSGSGSELRWYEQRRLGNRLRAAGFLTSFNGIAVGEFGEFYTTNNAGEGWTRQNFAAGTEMRALEINAFPLRAYAAGRSGKVLVTSDSNLARWAPITHPTVVGNGGNQWNGIGFNSTTTPLITLVGDGGTIVKQFNTDDFFPRTSGTNDDLHGVDYEGSTGVIVGENGTILRSTNAGSSWVPVAPPDTGFSWVNVTLRDVDLGPAGSGVAVGDFGVILRTADGGASWAVAVAPFTGPNLHDVYLTGARAWAVGEDGEYVFSVNSGTTWAREGTGDGSDYFGVAVNNDRVWAVGQSGKILHRPTDPPAGPILGLSGDFLDFGTVALGDTKRLPVTVFNRGTAELVVDGISAGSQVEVDRTSLRLAPGASARLNVYYQPSSSNDPAPGEPNRVVTFSANTAQGDHFLRLRVRSVPNGWRRIPSGTDQNLVAVQFESALVGYAAHAGGVIKTVDGGETWTALSFNPPGPIKAFHRVRDDDLLSAGGTPGNPFISRSFNGGSTWSAGTLPAGVRGPVADVHLFELDGGSFGFAVTERFTQGQTNEDGVVLRTFNGGGSWSETSRQPVSGVSGGAVFSIDDNFVYSAFGGALYRHNLGGAGATDWAQVFNLGGATLVEDLVFAGPNRRVPVLGVAVGTGGLLRRSENPTASAVNTVWSAPDIFTGGDITSVDFASEEVGWCTVRPVGGTPSSIYRTDDGGVRWKEDLASGGPVVNAVTAVGSAGDLAFAVGFGGAIWKYEPYAVEDRGVALLTSALEFGAVEVGAEADGTLTLTNVGGAALAFHGARLEAGVGASPFSLAPAAETVLAPGASVEFDLTFAPDAAADFSAQLRVNTDGPEGEVTAEVSGNGTAPAAVLIFDTEPPGFTVQVGGQTFTAPAAFTVRPGAGAGELEPGQTVAVSAPPQAARGGLDFAFQCWRPAGEGGGRAFDLAVPAAGGRYVARYVEVRPLPAAAPLPVADRPPEWVHEGVPDDVPAGPWLRLSNAELDVPVVGGLDVQGSVFLSAERIQASLRSGGLRVPESAAQPGVLEITASSFYLDFLAGAHFRLVAESPGVEVFEVPVAPPSELLIDVQEDGDFTASFQVLEDFPLVDGVVEFGAGGVALQRAGPFFTLGINGELRLLRVPGDGWAFQQAVDFEASDGPFTYTLDGGDLPGTLFSTPVLSMNTDNASSLVLQRTSGGAFSVAVNNVDVDLLSRPLANLSGTASTTGLVTFEAAPPSSPFAVGPFRLDVDGDTDLSWNVRTGAIAVTLPGSDLEASGVAGWPSGGVSFPGFTFDSAGTFDVSIPLPAFTFDGMSFSSAAANEADENYLRLKRNAAGTVSLALRDRRELGIGDLDLALDVNSAGAVSGSFAGSLSANLPVFGETTFGSVSMRYDASENTFPFQSLQTFFGQDFGFLYGPVGGQLRHLFCDPGETLIEDCDDGYFVLPF